MTTEIYRAVGQVGDGAMAPKETSHGGKPFRRCGVFVDDPFGEIMKDENGNDVIGYNGKPQRKRKQIQLVFSPDEKGANSFKLLSPGRKILFMGRPSTRPRIAKWNGGETRKEVTTIGGEQYVAYANETCHVMRIDLIDPALSFTLSRYKSAAIENGIPEDQAEAFVVAVTTQLTKRDDDSQGGNNSAPANQEVPPADDGEDGALF